MNFHANPAEEISKQIAEEIRVEMARQKNSRRALAAVVGLSEHTAGSRLAGRTPFTAPELFAVAIWLGTTVSDLVDRAERQVDIAKSKAAKAATK